MTRININGGVNKLLDNYDNLKSVLVHEHQHQMDFAQGKNTDFKDHANVYLKQFIDTSFKATTPEFKLGQIDSFSNYLLNMEKNDPNNSFSRNDVLNLISNFNNLKNGYTIEIDPISMNNLRLNIKPDNGTPIPVQYKQNSN